MLNCPHCESKARTNSGMAMHWSRLHPDTWKNTLEDSYPPGFDRGTEEPKRNKTKRSKLTEEQKVIRRKQQKNWYDKHKRKRPKDSNHLEEPRAFIRYCPGCGEDLTAYFLAAGAMARRRALGHG